MITIITPAHHRIDGLIAAIKSVEAQTMRDYEHLIIHDGPASCEWRQAMEAYGYGNDLFPWRRFVELGHHSHRGHEHDHHGSLPNFIGTFLAKGSHLCYLTDDDTYYPNHLEVLSKAVKGVDFAYSRMACARNGVIYSDCGQTPPKRGDLGGGALIHKFELTRYANWSEDDDGNDWLLVAKWLAAGATWRFADVITYLFNG